MRHVGHRFTSKNTKDSKAGPFTALSFVSFVSFVVTLLASASAHAQIYESVGTRAQGMGGAFVAVADDATASWWNPAGLASGAYFNALLEFDTIRQPGDDRTPNGQLHAGWETKVRGFAAAFPSLALSYYRLRISEIQPESPTAANAAGRQDQGSAGVGPRTLALSQFGATVGQSVGEHLVVGSTLKLVRGNGDTRTDLDLGVMASFGPARVGLGVRNVTVPEFEDGLRLRRQVRAGVSFQAGSGARSVTLAADADLTETAMVTGDERHVAVGAETWDASRRVGLRGGMSVNTVGERRPSASGGGSVGLRSGTYVDGYVTRGADVGRTGWGLSFRVTF